MDFEELVGAIGKTVDLFGVFVTVAGLALSFALYGRRVLRGMGGVDAYRSARQGIGRAILLGLELLVAGDIIRTVAVAPSFQTVGVLAIIVLIRSFLSLTLEMEISGRLPWRRERGPQPSAG
jgi:uncharacterized membrane protein